MQSESQICAGCYYQYRHYDEGDQIITNEPCLNCTCHNQMLMCFLRCNIISITSVKFAMLINSTRVCPFIKPVGQNCVVEKKDNQCCPTISCPPGQSAAIVTVKRLKTHHIFSYGYKYP